MNLIQHCAAPCNLAQAIAEEDSVAIRNIHMNGELIPALPMLRKCPCGLTSRQAILLSAISQRQGCIIAYTEIADLLKFFWGIETTKVAVRELAEKMNSRGFFAECRTEYEGILQGKQYVLSRKCCPLLVPPQTPAHAPAFSLDSPSPLARPFALDASPPRTAAFSSPLQPAPLPLLLKKEEDEEKGILSLNRKSPVKPMLTEDFLAVVEHELEEKWPFLRQAGFDFATFKRAADATKDPALLQKTWRNSFDYAEFDLQHHGGMHEPDGTPIKDPRTWVYGCLRKSGSYPRPRNYRTEGELHREAECRAEEERRKQQEEEAFQTAFEAWRGGLSEEDIREIAGPYCRNAVPLPLLRNRFRQIQQQTGQQQAMSPLNTPTLALRG